MVPNPLLLTLSLCPYVRHLTQIASYECEQMLGGGHRGRLAATLLSAVATRLSYHYQCV